MGLTPVVHTRWEMNDGSRILYLAEIGAIHTYEQVAEYQDSDFILDCFSDPQRDAVILGRLTLTNEKPDWTTEVLWVSLVMDFEDNAAITRFADPDRQDSTSGPRQNRNLTACPRGVQVGFELEATTVPTISSFAFVLDDYFAPNTPDGALAELNAAEPSLYLDVSARNNLQREYVPVQFVEAR